MRLQHAALCAAAAASMLAMSACEPKDVFGPEEGPPPRDVFFSVSVETETVRLDQIEAEAPDDMTAAQTGAENESEILEEEAN